MIEQLEPEIYSEIYSPLEDSYLMSNALKSEIPNLLEKNSNLKFLEIGAGSGINLETAFGSGIKKENILGTDINNLAVEHCKKLGFECISSDLFAKIPKNKKFDLIIFNPPYLTLDKKEPKSSRISTTAGKKGNEIIIKFLKQTKNYLLINGKIFLLTSSLSKKIDFKKLGYDAEKILSQKLFFEEIVLWCLKNSR